ncbi:MAG TPA: class IV adenylate cyclase, partial [Acidobacteriota bacterium]|nr:class IV adenylate cyclase [Acidobacteriota bacterium]
MNGQETEAKFYVEDLKKVVTRLRELEAILIKPRTLEKNTRFDLPDHSLRKEGRALRLRQDDKARLAYKGPGIKSEGVLSRREIEFGVEDFEKARQFLEALGYEKLIFYEKYRTTYEFEDTHIMLDEMPYGGFVEIESGSIAGIRMVSEKLRLKWSAAIAASY